MSLKAFIIKKGRVRCVACCTRLAEEQFGKLMDDIQYAKAMKKILRCYVEEVPNAGWSKEPHECIALKPLKNHINIRLACKVQEYNGKKVAIISESFVKKTNNNDKRALAIYESVSKREYEIV